MRPIKTPTFIIPTILRFAAIAVLLLAATWYVLWQGRHLILGPELSITDAPAAVESDRIVFISGTAENTTALYLNGRPIVTDQNGVFTEGIVLESGYSMVSLDARDRYGRSTHWERPVVLVDDQPTETAWLPMGYNADEVR